MTKIMLHGLTSAKPSELVTCVANRHSFQLSWLGGGGGGDQEAPQVGRAVSEAQELQCGFSEVRVSRPTLRKWVTGYEQSGLAGLTSQSRRPKTSPITRIGERERNWILALRRRRLGSRRIQSELDRAHDFQISRTTIDKVRAESGTVPLLRTSRNRKATKCYARQIPGERVQMDTCKIGPGRYQYTTVDACTRIRVLALYSRRSGSNTLLFLERVLEELPFPRYSASRLTVGGNSLHLLFSSA